MDKIKQIDNLQSSIESWLTNIDSLDIYDLDRVLSSVFKQDIPNIDLNNLITAKANESVSSLVVDRDLTSGEIIGYSEKFLPQPEFDRNNYQVLDPSLLDPYDLLTHIPTVGSGIDFSIDKLLLDQLNHTKTNSTIELNLINAFKFEDEALEVTEDSQEVSDDTFNYEIISPHKDIHEVFAAHDQAQQDIKALSSAKAKKWAIEADLKFAKEYDKIKDTLAFEWKFELDVFQKQAVYLMEQSECVFVAAHTSAGKTVVAEYATALAFKHKTKVIYTSPIKALSNQKFREFKTIFNDVGLITGDLQISPEASCLIMTTEILRSMLYRRSETLRDLEWVIFDEVHYMNDAHRGVVWEEVLILLPDHINIVMLSATIPNHFEFAEWVGKIKQRNIYVMCTKKRPVPLEHYLYTGNSNKTSNELFMLIDAQSTYLTRGYTQAIEAKKNRTKTSATNYGPKQTKIQAGSAQDKNIWLSLIVMLEKRDLLPAVCFVFSRKRCDENVNMLASMDLNTAEQKSEIHLFIQKSIATLNKEDRGIPQIVHLSESLKRGIGIHHSGILPIMKEIIEMLFQRGLIKILFATETFAMGINMPARTVVFDSTRKHDGTQFRNLLAGEYVQMAGRAGRRGLDSTGTVIILCKVEVPDTTELQQMMLGKAQLLESKFRITYSMILSLLRNKDIRIQDFMKRSFSEHKVIREDPMVYESAQKYFEVLLEKRPQLSCSFCANKMIDYYEDSYDFNRIKGDLYAKLEKNPNFVKALSSGRLVFTRGYRCDSSNLRLIPLMLIESFKDGKALAICLDDFITDEDLNPHNRIQEAIYPNSQDRDNFKLIERLKSFRVVNAELPLLSTFLEIFTNYKNSTLVNLDLNKIEGISNKQFKMNQTTESIIVLYRQLRAAHFDNFEFKSELKQELNKNQYFTNLSFELLNYLEAIYSQMNASDSSIELMCFTKDLNIRDIEFVNIYDSYKDIHARLRNSSCLSCPSFSEHFAETRINCALNERILYINDVISGNSLLLVSEYRYRVEVLKRLKLIDDRDFVLLKGKVALEISVMELFLTELIIENLFSHMQANEIVALLSSIVYQSKSSQDEFINSKSFNNNVLDQGRDRMMEIAFKINQVQKECNLALGPEDDCVEQLNFGLVEVVYEWSKGTPFTDIKQLTIEQEGIIVRTIQRLDEICGNLKDASRIIGDNLLYSKMEQCSVLIRRDIVFAGSLYTKTA